MYTKWIHHGEAQTILSTEPVVGESINEMFAVLNDIAGINDENDILDGTEVGIEDSMINSRICYLSSKWGCVPAARSICH